MSAPAQSKTLGLALWLCGGALLAFVIVPLLGLASLQSAAGVRRVLAMPDVRAAILLTLEAALTTAALALLFGAPLAYLLSRGRFPGRRLAEAVVDIPLTVPHTVAGIALLSVLGREGVIGKPALDWFGISFWGSFAGVVAAMLFVSLPYTVNSARIGFDAIDPGLEKVARTLGAGPWRVFAKVTLPLAWRSLMTGVTLTFARSVSEFGAVVILAYYPETAPVKIYDLFLQQGMGDSGAMALVMLVISLLLFLLCRHVLFGGSVRAEAAR
ncbi:MAG: ABC transporter permease [Burkholderiaceae bacterium]